MVSTRKVVLVTGGSRGIGAATARLAASAGYDVCLSYRQDRQQAETVASEVRELGGEAHIVALDLGSEDSVLAMFDNLDQRFGRIDALVNNAGMIGNMGPIATASAKEWEEIFRTNALGTFLVSRSAVQRMMTSAGGQGGTIVNLSSRAGQLGSPGRAHYAATKSAVDNMTVSLAVEVAGDGIRVNAVSPGPILTDIHRDAGPERLETLVSRIPMRRAGSPEEAANVIIWLMSDAASYVTGTIIPVSGGR